MVSLPVDTLEIKNQHRKYELCWFQIKYHVEMNGRGLTERGPSVQCHVNTHTCGAALTSWLTT